MSDHGWASLAAVLRGDFKIDIGLRREPTASQPERHNDDFQTAHAEFRRRLSESHCAG